MAEVKVKVKVEAEAKVEAKVEAAADPESLGLILIWILDDDITVR